MMVGSRPDVPARGTSSDDPETWTRARLVEPSTAGFVHVGASSGPWRLPVALPRRRRRRLLAVLHAAADAMIGDPRVVRADVFVGRLRPPGGGGRGHGGAPSAIPPADLDAVLLLETTSVATADQLRTDATFTAHLARVERASRRTVTFSGSNPRRMAPVEHDRQGVFLFNYFSAPDVATNLFAWQYTAGWFQDRTGLDNSTVLQPTDPAAVPYSLINHCRWDRFRDVVPALLFDRTFRGFVLRVFEANGVVPRPILHQLHRP